MSPVLPANGQPAAAPEDCPAGTELAAHAPRGLRLPGTLRDSNETARMLETLLGNLDGMVYRCRDDADWTMEFVSEGCARVTGYQPRRPDATTAAVSYESSRIPTIAQRVRAAIARRSRSARRFDLEYRILHADGALRWVWERGIGVYDEHGKRHRHRRPRSRTSPSGRKAEQALREAERRYHGLFDNAIEGIFRTTPDGPVPGRESALARIYGFDSPEELMSRCATSASSSTWIRSAAKNSCASCGRAAR